MKLFVFAAVLGVCAAGRLDNTYLPPNRGSNFGSSAYSGGGGGGGGGGFGGPGFGQTQHSGNVYNAGAYNGGGFGGGYQGASRSHEANAQILRYNSDVTGDHFNYDFETSNGIRAEASGVAGNGVQERGSFGYKGDDGHDYSITYTADENGYRPQGAHLPTSPPIPEAILKSLEQNARDEAAGISDDGSYRGEGSQGGYSGPSSQYGAPSAAYQAPHGGFGGAAASRQYLAPNAGGRGGSGNFNSQSGYHY